MLVYGKPEQHIQPPQWMQGIVKNVERASPQDALASTIPADGKHLRHFHLHQSETLPWMQKRAENLQSDSSDGSPTMRDDEKLRPSLPPRSSEPGHLVARHFERTSSEKDSTKPLHSRSGQHIQPPQWMQAIVKDVEGASSEDALASTMAADGKHVRHFPRQKSETPQRMQKRAENLQSDSSNASPTMRDDDKLRPSFPPCTLTPCQISEACNSPKMPSGPIDNSPSPYGVPSGPALAPFPVPKHVMLSGRFIKADRILYMKKVKMALEALGIRTFMVDVEAGQSFGERTMAGLAFARVMIAFCTSTYGERTGGGYETYEELKYVYEHRNECHLIALKLNETYPPVPPDPDGQSLCKFVFSPGTVYIDGLTPDSSGRVEFKDPQDVALNVLQCLQKLSLFDEVAMTQI